MCRGRHKTLIPNYTSAMDDLRCWPNAWAHHRVAADREGLIRPAPLPVGGGMVGAHPRIAGADPDAGVLKPGPLRHLVRAVGRGVMPNLDTDFRKAVPDQQLVGPPPALSTTDDDFRLRVGQVAAVSRMFGGRAMPAALNSGPTVPVAGVRSLICWPPLASATSCSRSSS